MTTSATNLQQRAVYEAFTISDKSATTKKEKSVKEQDPFIIRPQTSSSTISAPTPQTNTAWSETAVARRVIDVLPISNSLPSDRSFDVSREAVIFSPPNCISDADDHLPTTSWAAGRYNAPVKAAGDVSLSGPQLAPFLTKVTMRLSRVKGEGVQIRLRGLIQALEEESLSDGFIQKFNFLIDALDRSAYDQAWREFVVLNENFEAEMNVQWETGLKLLIRELLPQNRPNRVSSAGGLVRNQ